MYIQLSDSERAVFRGIKTFVIIIVIIGLAGLALYFGGKIFGLYKDTLNNSNELKNQITNLEVRNEKLKQQNQELQADYDRLVDEKTFVKSSPKPTPRPTPTFVPEEPVLEEEPETL